MKRQVLFIKDAISSLIRRRSRMMVALLSVVIGGTILSGLLTLYLDVPRQLSEEFRAYGANVLMVPNGSNRFKSLDLSKVIQLIDSKKIVGVSPFFFQNVRIREQPLLCAATDYDEIKKTSPYWYTEGRLPEKANELMAGSNVAAKLSLESGNVITVSFTDEYGVSSDKSYTICGILHTGGNEDDFIYLTFDGMKKLNSVADGFDVAQLSLRMSKDELSELCKSLNLKQKVIDVRVVKKVANSEASVLGKLKALVYVVVFVVLLLTMVCVCTTMIAVVAERRKEIGLRKALGASNRDIVFMFMGESVFLGLFGGIAGALAGFFFARYVSLSVFAKDISPEFFISLLSVLICILISAISCILPVKSATRVDPAKVLKGE
ncbi:MAG: ABC transporter permease [Succinivibrio sp.]